MGLRRIAKEGLNLTNRRTQMFDTSKQPEISVPTMNNSKRTEPNHNNKIKPFTGGIVTATNDTSIINGGTTADKSSRSISGDANKSSIFKPRGDGTLNGGIGEKNSLSTSGGSDGPRLFLGSSGDVAMPTSLLKGSPFLEAALGVNSSVANASSFFGNDRTRSPDYHRSMPPDLVDSLPSSLDSIAWNQDGTQTIIENGSRTSTKSSTPINEECKDEPTTLEEIRKLKEENKQLKKSVEEAAAVNCAWRKFHEDRQGYVQRLLTTIHELQHASNKKHSELQEGAGSSGPDGPNHNEEAETRRLKEDLARLQAEHHDHVTLLEMQVRAHRDDWEAERSDKKAAQKALEETEARAAQFLQEIQQLQTKVCRQCSGASRTDEGTTVGPPSTSSNSTTTLNSNSRFSPVTTVSGCAHTGSSSDNNSISSVASSLSPPAAVPQTAVTDLPTTPLKGWIPVSMLHHIAFSGQTPEHQSSPMMGRQQQQQQQQQRTQQHQTDPSMQRSKQTQQRSHQKPRQPQSKHHHTHTIQQTSSKSAFPINSINKSTSLNESENNFRNIFSQEKSIVKKRNEPNDKVLDKKFYELMGARPKVIGESKVSPLVSSESSISGATEGILEDEFQAKHRARSILASAIPISPSSPTSSFAPMKSPSVPNILKGYMPITSTILTPINFRPCSNQRRKSVQTTAASLISESLNKLSDQDRSDSSPALLETPSETVHLLSENIPQNLNEIKDPEDMTGCSSKIDKTSQPVYSTEESCITQGSTVTNTLTCSKDSSHNDICTSIPSAYRSVKVENESENPTSNTCNLNERLGSPVSSTNSTSITVTTTADGVCNSSTTSTYSSATSSRSSSPGFSLTTFALNSEGRGIPGTIFFAMGNEQKGCLSPPPRSPAPSVSPGRTSAASLKSPTPDIVTAGLSISPPSIKSPPIGPNTRIRSPSIQINSVKSPPISTNNAQNTLINSNNSNSSHKNHNSKSKTQEHWWSVEGPNSKGIKHKGGDNSKLVNSTWVRLMGGEAHSKTGSSLPWRTARAVPGHQLDQVRRSSQEEKDELNSNFNYSPAMTSPSNSVFSSTCPSTATSPPPGFEAKPKSPEKDLKEIASKNIASAIISYELGAKTEANTTSNTTTYTITNPPPLPTTNIHDMEKSIINIDKENLSSERSRGSSITSSCSYMSDGVETLTRIDLVCPTCQMLFSHDRHLLFLDHFETCRGPTFVDM